MNKYLAFIDKRWRLIFLVLSVTVVLLNIYGLYVTVPFNSDGVELQNSVAVLQKHIHTKTILPIDNSILKTPFYLVLQHAGISPETELVISLASFILVAYFGVYVSLAWLNSIMGWFNEKYLALGFLYLCSIGGTYQYLMIANTRNAEIGISFLLLVPLAAIFKRKSNRLFIVLTTLLVSALLFDDPYFSYAFFGPILALILVGAVLTKKCWKSLLTAGVIGAGIILSKVWLAILSKFGIYFLPIPIRLLKLSKVLVNAKGTIVAMLLLGGAAYYNNRFNLVPFSFYLNAIVIFALMAYSLFFICSHIKTIHKDPWQIFLAGLPWIISAIFFLQPTGDIVNYRYMVIAPFSFPFIVAILLKATNSRIRTFLIAAFVLVTFFNIQHTFNVIGQGQKQNADNIQIVHVVESLGLTKGYTDYWSGNINTFYASQKVYFLPVSCSPEHMLQPMYWLVDTAEYSDVKTNQSFYLFDKLGTYTAGCQPEVVSSTLGQPYKTIDINSRYVLAIYNYDIATKMDLKTKQYGP